ncbi:PREDICTED: serrate RNA effector molecule homolog [Theobroma cacao]|uniref:Serrate RNA effector molecule homolog n=1 Tax=Theobroma cacao TaxID=3641 RepID=A0AB32V0X8_THECC|nr:PREDICTED: serrate RNA effector molecule homolog [Theobroma cacao]
MPSGAKKRKAAKKKKEQAANNINSSTNNNPHGNDDPKSQDERDSDGGDVGSPASQDDQNHQNAFSQGREEGKSAPSSVQSYVTEDKSVEEAARDLDSTEKLGLDDVVAVKIDKELEPKEDMESTRVIIQHVEHDKSSSSSSRSSSSSSDDESEASEKKSKEEAFNFVPEATSYNIEDKSATIMSEEVVKVAENEKLGDVDSNSAVETAAVDNLVKTVLSVPEEVDHAVEISLKKSVVSDVVEVGLKESEEKLLPSTNGFSRDELEGNEGKIFPLSSTSTAESSNVAEKIQESGTPDYSEKQPFVASTPPMVQRTSVLSCCGLFDIFTGSGR